MSSPWLKFYPSDWRSDPALRLCGLAARGLWIELLCIMHEADPRGYLLVNSSPLTDRQIAALIGSTVKEVASLLAELEEAGVLSKTDAGVIYSRRIVRDSEKAERDKANGGKGGNPNLRAQVNGGVNPNKGGVRVKPSVNGGDKAQKPEARSQTRPSQEGEDGRTGVGSGYEGGVQ